MNVAHDYMEWALLVLVGFWVICKDKVKYPLQLAKELSILECRCHLVIASMLINVKFILMIV